jgi:hypothetical protein
VHHFAQGFSSRFSDGTQFRIAPEAGRKIRTILISKRFNQRVGTLLSDSTVLVAAPVIEPFITMVFGHHVLSSAKYFRVNSDSSRTWFAANGCKTRQRGQNRGNPKEVLSDNTHLKDTPAICKMSI